MDIIEGILEAKAGTAVAFLGAGFSVGAHSSVGPVMTGGKLQEILARELGIPETTPLLQTTQIYEDEKGSSALRFFIEQNFTATQFSIEHKVFASIPWRRIYTTNYDDIFEVAARSGGFRVHSATLFDKPDSLPRNSKAVVHLHGGVDNLRTAGRSVDLQLTMKSYLESQFPTSAWVPVFRNDLNFASAVFFLGYSLQDLDISRIIFDKALTDKTFIIVHPDTTPIEKRRLEKFGKVVSLTISELANVFDKVEFVETEGANRSLLCFERYEFSADSRAANQDDYVQLLVRGTFSPECYVYQSNYDIAPYATQRSASKIVLNGEHSRILIHSNMGNGKSTFLDQLSLSYLQRNFRVYRFLRKTDNFSSEIDYILRNKQDRICFIFDGITSSREVIKYLSTRISTFDRLLLSCRTITYEIDKNEIFGIIGKDFLEIDLNFLTSEEIDHIEKSFTQFGIWGSDTRLTPERRKELIRDQCSSEIRSIVLRSFSEGAVADKIRDWSKSARASGSSAQRLIMGVIFSTMAHADVTLIDLCDILGVGFHSAKRELFESGALDILALNGIYAEVRSAILAEHIAKHTFPPELALDCLTRLVRNLSDWVHSGEQYKNFIRELMRFAIIGRIFEGDRRDFIVQFYENVRNLEYCRGNPAFWLQYAMARIAREEFQLAEMMLNTAEGRASVMPGYNLFQINNQKAKLLLLSRAKDDKYTDFDRAYLDAVRLINSQITEGDGKRDPYPLRLIPAHEEFIARRYDSLSPAVQKLAPRLVSRLEQELAAYSKKGNWNDETEWKLSLKRTRSFLSSKNIE